MHGSDHQRLIEENCSRRLESETCKFPSATTCDIMLKHSLYGCNLMNRSLKTCLDPLHPDLTAMFLQVFENVYVRSIVNMFTCVYFW